jgi:transcriptional regulator with XRE-family HTH domain
MSYFWKNMSVMKPYNAIISFGEHLRLLRDTQNLSLREVSHHTGIDTSLLGKIERDKRQPTNDQIKHLADFFNIDERLLKRQNLSDQLAYQIIEANADIDVLRVAEQKIEYLKKRLI